MTDHPIVSREAWTAARKVHLAREKEFTRLRDQISAERRELPWVKVEENYVFESPRGRASLAELFEGRGQLIVYHFMFGPGWTEGCPSCAFIADHFEGMLPHLNARDVTLLAISRAPLDQIEAFKKRMGWKFQWVSSFGNDFNHDYGVSFTSDEMARGQVDYNYQTGPSPVEELPGASVFVRQGGDVFHTYSSYARGLDLLVGTYNFLDIAPKGRDEAGLDFSMAWVRHHDKYGAGYVVDPHAPYIPPQGANCPHCMAEVRS